MVELLMGWGSLIVAALALIQPWCISLWKRLFRSGTIDIHETGTIEIGFSSFGPTIGLHGTLRAVHRDQFVRSIDLTLTRLKDEARHSFEWGVFRAQKLSIRGGEELLVELPYGLMLLTTQPHRYNILFFDLGLQKEMRPHIEGVQRAWAQAVLQAPPPTQQGLQNLYLQFSGGTPHVDAFTALDRLFYWVSGTYSLEVRVNTARPDNTFQRTWTFELTESNVRSLRLNALKIVQDACGQQNLGQYNFANAPYQEPVRLGQ